MFSMIKDRDENLSSKLFEPCIRYVKSFAFMFKFKPNKIWIKYHSVLYSTTSCWKWQLEICRQIIMQHNSFIQMFRILSTSLNQDTYMRCHVMQLFHFDVLRTLSIVHYRVHVIIRPCLIMTTSIWSNYTALMWHC